jgi:hypothetical protein
MEAGAPPPERKDSTPTLLRCGISLRAMSVEAHPRRSRHKFAQLPPRWEVHLGITGKLTWAARLAAADAGLVDAAFLFHSALL